MQVAGLTQQRDTLDVKLKTAQSDVQVRGQPLILHHTGVWSIGQRSTCLTRSSAPWYHLCCRMLALSEPAA